MTPGPRTPDDHDPAVDVGIGDVLVPLDELTRMADARRPPDVTGTGDVDPDPEAPGAAARRPGREDSPSARRSADVAPQLPAALFHGVRAAGRRRSWALTLDVVVVAAVAAVGVLAVLALGARTTTTVVVGVLLGVGTLAWAAADLRRHGRSPGHRLLGLRTVARDTAMPGGVRTLSPRHGVAADLRRGRDPLRLVPAALTPVAGSADPWLTGGARAVPAGVVLIGDDGSVLPVPRSTIVGRNPADATGVHRLLGIPDLSRTISRSHALLEPEGSTVWVTDLGSANGTAIASSGQVFEYLPPGVRVAAPVGARLALGERVLRVADSRRSEAAA
jgi:hypothetical protein